MEIARIDSPLGVLRATFDGRGGLAWLGFEEESGTAASAEVGPASRLARQLRAYFAGELREFTIPLAAEGTEFQKRVWDELLRIPYGSAMSYRELAQRTGSVARAVGQANGSNPVAIVIPCHRVIAADGTLGGYAGGVWRKERLLELEGWRGREIASDQWHMASSQG
jgi:methylated-DNA-[protein]-cysteine S-methyltransferase